MRTNTQALRTLKGHDGTVRCLPFDSVKVVAGSSDCIQLSTALVDFITANVNDSDIFSGFESPLYAAHLFVISLFILLHTLKREGTAKFFTGVARFLIYGFSCKESVWDDISELELLAMQVFGAASAKYTAEVSSALTESGFLASATKVSRSFLDHRI